MKIIIADDHVIFREGVKKIVSTNYENIVLIEADCVEMIVDELSRNYDAEILILDISIGEKNSLFYIADFLKIIPKLKIIILSMYNDKQYILKAFQAGVYSYLTKEKAAEELILAINKATKGEKFINDIFSENMSFLLTNRKSVLHENLSNREYEIFLLIVKGKTVTEISHQLHLSVKTVSTHRRRILDKMQMTSNYQLVEYANQNGLIS